MKLSLAKVSVTIDSVPIVAGADLTIGPGEKVALVGPNGSGKTTLLRTIYRSVRPTAGTIMLDGSELSTLKQKDVARRAALVAQESTSDFDFCVRDIVALGRAPHQHAFNKESDTDQRAIAEALERTGMSSYRNREFTTLSGGEKQRVLLARALAQRTDLLLLDEPTNHLDINAALDLLDLVRTLELSTLCVLHDLNLAAAYCDRLCVLHAGRIVAVGTPTEVLTESLVRDVFGVRAHRLTHPVTGGLLLAFSPIAVCNPGRKPDAAPDTRSHHCSGEQARTIADHPDDATDPDPSTALQTVPGTTIKETCEREGRADRANLRRDHQNRTSNLGGRGHNQ